MRSQPKSGGDLDAELEAFMKAPSGVSRAPPLSSNLSSSLDCSLWNWPVLPSKLSVLTTFLIRQASKSSNTAPSGTSMHAPEASAGGDVEMS